MAKGDKSNDQKKRQERARPSPSVQEKFLALDEYESMQLLADGSGGDSISVSEHAADAFDKAQNILNQSQSYYILATEESKASIKKIEAAGLTVNLLPRLLAIYWSYRNQLPDEPCLVISVGADCTTGGLIVDGNLQNRRENKLHLSLRGLWQKYVESNSKLKGVIEAYRAKKSPDFDEELFNAFQKALKTGTTTSAGPVDFHLPIGFDCSLAAFKEFFDSIDSEGLAKTVVLSDWGATHCNLAELLKQNGKTVVSTNSGQSFHRAVKGLVMYGRLESRLRNRSGLKFRPSKLLLQQVNIGTPIQSFVVIESTVAGPVQIQISSNTPWIKPSPQTFRLGDSKEQKVSIEIDPSTFAPSSINLAELEFKSFIGPLTTSRKFVVQVTAAKQDLSKEATVKSKTTQATDTASSPQKESAAKESAAKPAILCCPNTQCPEIVVTGEKWGCTRCRSVLKLASEQIWKDKVAIPLIKSQGNTEKARSEALQLAESWGILRSVSAKIWQDLISTALAVNPPVKPALVWKTLYCPMPGCRQLTDESGAKACRECGVPLIELLVESWTSKFLRPYLKGDLKKIKNGLLQDDKDEPLEPNQLLAHRLLRALDKKEELLERAESIGIKKNEAGKAFTEEIKKIANIGDEALYQCIKGNIGPPKNPLKTLARKHRKKIIKGFTSLGVPDVLAWSIIKEKLPWLEIHPDQLNFGSVKSKKSIPESIKLSIRNQGIGGINLSIHFKGKWIEPNSGHFNLPQKECDIIFQANPNLLRYSSSNELELHTSVGKEVLKAEISIEHPAWKKYLRRFTYPQVVAGLAAALIALIAYLWPPITPQPIRDLSTNTSVKLPDAPPKASEVTNNNQSQQPPVTPSPPPLISQSPPVIFQLPPTPNQSPSPFVPNRPNKEPSRPQTPETGSGPKIEPPKVSDEERAKAYKAQAEQFRIEAEQKRDREDFDGALIAINEAVKRDPDNADYGEIKDGIRDLKRISDEQHPITPPKRPPQEVKQPVSPPQQKEPPARLSITPPRKLKDGKVNYPTMAKQMRISGTVEVQITIGVDGRVSEAKAKSGHPLLRQAAEEAARGTIFKAAEKNGEPTTYIKIIPIVFTLKE